MKQHVTLGIERLVTEEKARIDGRRVGLLAHPASVDHHYVHSLTVLLQCGAKVERLFGPEHGFMGEAQDMEAVDGRSMHPSGIPLISLYGRTSASLSPSVSDLKGLDVLVVDLMDVGSRYYTFVWTALLALRACALATVEMILTDRPNPLGGVALEGPPQQPGFLSFVGLKPVPVRHGMTVGEIVSMAAAEEGLSDYLTIVKMHGWERRMGFDDTDVPWVLPSPNMPTVDTALVYPGMCLIEGTEISEGRGTTRPFEFVGAPGLDGRKLAERLESFGLLSVRFRPVAFKPGFQKQKDLSCGGVQLHVTSKETFRPYRTGVAMLVALKAEMKDRFQWRHAPYEFVTDIPAIDLLTGSAEVRTMIDEGAHLLDIVSSWTDGEEAFQELRRNVLFYE
jgi:uncharacterized protein YbbC (DUF1343 family)